MTEKSIHNITAVIWLEYCLYNPKQSIYTISTDISLALYCLIYLSAVTFVAEKLLLRRTTEKNPINQSFNCYGHSFVFVLVVIDTVTVSVFATGVQELLEAYSLGWTFYCAIALPGLTICFFIPYWISTNESCMYLLRDIPFFNCKLVLKINLYIYRHQERCHFYVLKLFKTCILILFNGLYFSNLNDLQLISMTVSVNYSDEFFLRACSVCIFICPSVSLACLENFKIVLVPRFNGKRGMSPLTTNMITK